MKMTKITITILFLTIISCTYYEQFSREAWNTKEDFLYPKRMKVVDDLIKNYLKTSMCEDEILNLLGSPSTPNINIDADKVYFELQTKYGNDIDPIWTKYLVIQLDSNRCYKESEILKIR